MQKSLQIFSKAICFYDFENLLLADSTDSSNVQLYNITCFRTVKSEAPFCSIFLVTESLQIAQGPTSSVLMA